MNIIKFHTGRVIGNFIEVTENNLEIKQDYFNIVSNSIAKYIKDVTEEDCLRLFIEIDPPILNMESPVELKYKFGKYCYANALDCFKDLLEENNLKITDNYLILT